MKTRYHGHVRYWALILSLAVHTVVLGVFTGIQLKAAHADTPAEHNTVSMHMVQRVIEQSPPVRPKPRMEPVPEETPAPQPQQAAAVPLITEPLPPKPAEPQPPQQPGEVVVLPPDIEPAVVNEVEFFGQKSVTDRICYVVDCSGSMYGQMYRVRDQLISSIMKLNSNQAYAVVFFMDGQQLLTSGSGKLEPATAQSKSRTLELIESVRPGGTTDAAYALKYAMSLKDRRGNRPQVIYFLTDGFDLDAESSSVFAQNVLSLRRSLVPGAVLHTIGFWPQPQDCRTLARLAGDTGGEFIKVSE